MMANMVEYKVEDNTLIKHSYFPLRYKSLLLILNYHKYILTTIKTK